MKTEASQGLASDLGWDPLALASLVEFKLKRLAKTLPFGNDTPSPKLGMEDEVL